MNYSVLLTEIDIVEDTDMFANDGCVEFLNEKGSVTYEIDSSDEI